MEAEYPVWRIILETGLPLSEVNSWHLGRIYDLNEILNMKDDYQTAFNAYQTKTFEDINKGKK